MYCKNERRAVGHSRVYGDVENGRFILNLTDNITTTKGEKIPDIKIKFNKMDSQSLNKIRTIIMDPRIHAIKRKIILLEEELADGIKLGFRNCHINRKTNKVKALRKYLNILVENPALKTQEALAELKGKKPDLYNDLQKGGGFFSRPSRVNNLFKFLERQENPKFRDQFTKYW